MEASRFTGDFKYLTNLEFPTAGEATKRGVALNTIGNLADVGSDIIAGLTLGLPTVFAKSFLEGAGSSTREIDAKLDQMVSSGQLEQDPRFTDAVAQYQTQLINAGDPPAIAAEQARLEAIEAVRQNAYGQAVAPAGTVAAVGDTFLAGLAKPATKLLPTNKLFSVTAATAGGATSEALTEGGEQVLTNRAQIEGLGATDVTLGQNVGGAMVEAALPGGVASGTARAVLPSGAAVDTTVLDPSKSPTAGQIADSSVQSAYDSVITPAPEELLAITDQTETASESRITAAEELMRSQIDQTGMIKPDAIAKVADQLGLTLFEASEAGNRAIEGKMNDDANSLRARAEQSVIDTGGIPEELNAEINDLLSENPDVAASIVDDAFNRPFVSNTGQSRLQLASDMDAAPVVDTAPVSQPTVMDVSPAQQAINYGAMQAQEAAYTAAKGATGDDAAAEAAGEAAYNNFLRNPSGLPEAPTEGIAPKVDTTSVGAASIAKAPASGIETVVAKSPDDIIAEQRAAAPVKTFTTAKGSTYDAFGDGTTVRDRAERGDGEV